MNNNTQASGSDVNMTRLINRGYPNGSGTSLRSSSSNDYASAKSISSSSVTSQLATEPGSETSSSSSSTSMTVPAEQSLSNSTVSSSSLDATFSGKAPLVPLSSTLPSPVTSRTPSSGASSSSSSPVATNTSSSICAGTYGGGKSVFLALGQFPALNYLKTTDSKGKLVPYFSDMAQQGFALASETMGNSYLTVKDISVANDIEKQILKFRTEEKELLTFASAQPSQSNAIETTLAQPPQPPQLPQPITETDLREIESKTSRLGATSAGINCAALLMKFLDICSGGKWCFGVAALAGAALTAVAHIGIAHFLRNQAIDIDTKQENRRNEKNRFYREQIQYYQQLPFVNDIDAMLQELSRLRVQLAKEQNKLKEAKNDFDKISNDFKKKSNARDDLINRAIKNLDNMASLMRVSSTESKEENKGDVEQLKKLLYSYLGSTAFVTEKDKGNSTNFINKVIAFLKVFLDKNEKCDGESKFNLIAVLNSLREFSSSFIKTEEAVATSNKEKEIHQKEVDAKNEIVKNYNIEVANIEETLRKVNDLMQNWKSKTTEQPETKKQSEVSSLSTVSLSSASLLAIHGSFPASTALSSQAAASSSTAALSAPLVTVVVDKTSSTNNSNSQTMQANITETRPAAQ